MSIKERVLEAISQLPDEASMDAIINEVESVTGVKVPRTQTFGDEPYSEDDLRESPEE